MKFVKLTQMPKNKKVKINKFKLEKRKKYGKCDICIRVCESMGIGAIKIVGRAALKKVVFNSLKQCVGCAVCAEVCSKSIIKVMDENGEREIWGEKFKLAKCENCGEYYETEEYVKYVHNKAGLKLDKFICGKCKRKVSTEVVEKYI